MGKSGGNGSADFDFTAVAGGIADGISSGAASFNFIATAGGISEPPEFRSTNDGFILPKFRLNGVGSFSFPDPYEPPVQEIRWINRNVLAQWGWGRDGDNWSEMFGLRNKLDIITKNMPVKWSDGGGPVLQSEPQKAISSTPSKVRVSKESENAETLPKSKTELPVDAPQPPRPTTPLQTVVQPAKTPLTGPKSFCKPIANAKSDNRVQSSIRIQAEKPRSVKEPASIALPVEYISKATIRSTSVIETKEPKKEVQVRTNFDVGVRRSKRH